jgi:hypothetical protein
VRRGGFSLASTVMFLFGTVALESGAIAQVGANCSRTVSPYGIVTEVCPSGQAPGAGSGVPQAGPTAPPIDRGGPPIRMRFGIPIPTCPAGKAYSIEHQQCMPAQYIGGVIPCSQDDQTFEAGRYVPNCR